MTPIVWRSAQPGDEEALSLLGQATFLATFAFDHPGPALSMAARPHPSLPSDPTWSTP